MKTTIKYLLLIIFIVSISIFVSRCKSGRGVKTSDTTEAADSTVVIAKEPEVLEDTTSVAEEIETVVTQKPLTVTVQNLESITAPVYISVYGTKNNFPEPKGQLKEYKFKAHGKELTVQIPNLKFGTYAIASYQDVNSSGKIDKNLIGIPTEGYAFSNNYKPTVKAPNFDDCSFAYDAKNNSVTIKMIR